MKNLPLVSIAIPSYNHGDFIEDTIQSALSQTYPNIEVVIIDDSSSDKSKEIISKFKNHSKIKKIIFHEKNWGMTKTFNHCITETSGEYILLMGSDDILTPSIISKQINIFKKYPSVGMVHTAIKIINEKNHCISHSLAKKVNSRKIFADTIRFPKKTVLKKIIERNCITMPSALVSRKCYSKAGLYNKNMKFQDYEMWFRVLKYFDIYFMSKPLLMYRFHSQNYSISNYYLTNKEKNKECIKVINGLEFEDSELIEFKNKRLAFLYNELKK